MDVSLLTIIDDKLQSWAEHFNSGANCGVEVNEVTITPLPDGPDITIHPVVNASCVLAGDDDLCACLSEREVCLPYTS